MCVCVFRACVSRVRELARQQALALDQLRVQVCTSAVHASVCMPCVGVCHANTHAHARLLVPHKQNLLFVHQTHTHTHTQHTDTH